MIYGTPVFGPFIQHSITRITTRKPTVVPGRLHKGVKGVGFAQRSFTVVSGFGPLIDFAKEPSYENLENDKEISPSKGTKIKKRSLNSKKNDNRVQEVSEITQGLKALAKELSVPVLALSQLSRAVEQREEKKPQLSDLRESGSIEQDADVVLFVYREEYYEEKKQPKLGSIEHAEWQSKMNDIAGLAEILIGKQRHGPTGNIQVEFEGMYTRFKDLSQ